METKNISIPKKGSKWLHRILMDDIEDGQIIRVPGSLSVLTDCCWYGKDSVLITVNEKKATRDIQIRKISFRVPYENYPDSIMNLDGYQHFGSTSDAIYFYKTLRIKERIKIKSKYGTKVRSPAATSRINI